MRNMPEHRLRQSRVTAVFEDSALSFILAKGATLEDLSDRLGNLGRRHNGMPVDHPIASGASVRSASTLVTDRLQTEKLVPQPQAAVAFGFLILNDALIRSST
jgi:hypothetical protein